MCCNGSPKPYCTDPSLKPQGSVATTITGRGIGSSYGCFKPENQNSASCCGGGEPLAGTPLAEWEAQYGKLKTTVSKVRMPINGTTTGWVTVVQKVPESPASTTTKRVSCCSIRYKACPTNC